MRLNFILPVVVLFAFFSCDTKKDFPDPSENYFLKYYGKEGTHKGIDFVINTDGSFVIFGTSEVLSSEGSANVNLGSQLYLAKVDPKGQVLWEKNLGGTLDEEARDIELMADGNLVLVANVAITPTDRDFIIMTLTQDGNKIDSVSFGVEAGLDDDAISVTELNDGFMVCGSKAKATSSLTATDTRDAIQVRFTRTLGPYPIWTDSYSQGDNDVAIKAIQVSPNNNIIFGYTNGSNANDINNSINYWVYNLNSFGVPQSQNKIGSPLENEFMGSVTLSPAILGEGYLLSGIAVNPTGNNSIYLVKHSATPSWNINDVQFERSLDDNLGDVPNNRVFATPSFGTGFLLLTNRLNSAGNTDMYLTKVDSRGQRLWDSPVILGGEANDFAGAISELPDGRIMVLGTIKVGGLNGQDKIVLMKLNSSGRLRD